jgi:hypothetical protein
MGDVMAKAIWYISNSIFLKKIKFE